MNSSAADMEHQLFRHLFKYLQFLHQEFQTLNVVLVLSLLNSKPNKYIDSRT